MIEIENDLPMVKTCDALLCTVEDTGYNKMKGETWTCNTCHYKENDKASK